MFKHVNSSPPVSNLMNQIVSTRLVHLDEVRGAGVDFFSSRRHVCGRVESPIATGLGKVLMRRSVSV
jgi:hypothetical protein